MMRLALMSICVFSAVADCKQARPAFAFVLGGTVPVQSGTGADSEAMRPAMIGESLELRNGPGYYEIKQDGVTGYVSESEAGVRGNMDVFTPITMEQSAYVLASGLRIRAKPIPDGQVIAVLQAKTILPVLAMGSRYTIQDGRQGRWLQVKQGKQEGYVFSAFVVTGPGEELMKLGEGGTIYEQGLLEHRILRLFDGETLTLLTPQEMNTCKAGWNPLEQQQGPFRGGVSRYHSVTVKNGKPYYHLGNVYCERDSSAGVAASAEDVFRIENMTAYTAPMRRDLPPALIQAVSVAMDQNVDARSIAVYRLPSSDGNSLLVRAWRGYCFEGGDQIVCWQAVYLKEKGGVYTALGVFQEPDIADLNGDGVPEIITQYGTRGGMVYDLYTLKEGKFEAVWHRTPEFGGRLRIAGRTLVITSHRWTADSPESQPREQIVTTQLVMQGSDVKEVATWRTEAPPH